MKKWLLILFIGLVVASYFAYQDPGLRAYFQKHTDDILPAAVTQMQAYRWQDKNGQWQLSDMPPANGIPYETVEYHKNTNVIPTERLTGEKK
ncbi:hypothetical protein MNBD_GAMMA21-351 [hydrothermal vent metagenome]|uniref:DUF4124 domain-containing protein n=1 Tax=hydrothermal vent metagenome TaxID=652676 RepID=A0A3B0ZD52_9ZZZZ